MPMLTLLPPNLMIQSISIVESSNLTVGRVSNLLRLVNFDVCYTESLPVVNKICKTGDLSSFRVWIS